MPKLASAARCRPSSPCCEYSAVVPPQADPSCRRHRADRRPAPSATERRLIARWRLSVRSSSRRAATGSASLPRGPQGSSCSYVGALLASLASTEVALPVEARNCDAPSERPSPPSGPFRPLASGQPLLAARPGHCAGGLCLRTGVPGFCRVRFWTPNRPLVFKHFS